MPVLHINLHNIEIDLYYTHTDNRFAFRADDTTG